MASGCGLSFAPTSVAIAGYGAVGATASPAGGSCYSISFAVPAGRPAGSYTVAATAGATDSGILAVGAGAASLSLSPSSVAAGGQVVVTGAGFSAGAQVSVSAFGTSQTLTASGGVFTVTIAVPAGTAAGTYTLTAVDTANLSATAGLTVTAPAGTIQPGVTAALAGQAFQVTATGFSPNEQVSLSLALPASNPIALSGTLQLYQADSAGNITNVQYTVPPIAPGDYLLLAYGQTSGLSRTTPFTLVAGAPTQTATPQSTLAYPTATPDLGLIYPTAPPSTIAVPPTATSAPPPPTATPLPLPPLPAVAAPATTRYFADGYTGTAAVDGKVTFAVRLFLYNPGPAPAEVTTTYAVYNPADRSRTSVVERQTVAAGVTVSRQVNRDIGNDRMVSATVSAPGGIVADEVVTRTRGDGTVLDADSSPGSSHLSTVWYLAEGYTGESLQEYITLYNPGAAAAHAQVRYLPDGTPPPALVTVTVPAHGQVVLNVRGQYTRLAPGGSRNVAAQITADAPVAVDRAMYWGDGAGSAKYGYSLSPALASGAQSQYFAILPTAGGSQSFVTVLNPNDGEASIALALLDASGNTLKIVSATVAGHARHTFAISSILPGDSGDLSGGLVSSSLPVVAEAALYYGGSPNVGRHPGLVEPGSAGSLRGARAGVDPAGASLYVFNPGSAGVRVRVGLGGAAGGSVAFDAVVAGASAQAIPLPGGGGTGGVTLLASGPVVATLVNGAPGRGSIWGGGVD